MSIRPVDMQVLLPKSAEFNANNNHNKMETNQQQFAQTFNKQLEKESKIVIQTSKSDEKNNINKDGRNKDERSGKNKKRGRHLKEEDEDKKTKNGGMFDFTI